MPVRVVLPLLLLLLMACACAAEDRLELRFYCLDVHDGVLDRIGRDRTTGQLPARIPLALALSLLDPDLSHMVGFAHVSTLAGREGSDDRTHKATYVEPSPAGGLVQRTSDWDEGMIVRITPTIDGEGRIRIDGQLSLRSIDSRASIVGVEQLPLGRPMTHSTQNLNPAAVLRAGEVCVITTMGSGSAELERLLLIVAERSQR